MKIHRLNTLLALLLMAGWVTMQGQETLEVELISEGKGYNFMLPISEDEFLVHMRGDESGHVALCRMKTDGTELEYVAQNHLNEGGYDMYGASLLYYGKNGQPLIVYHKRKADSLWICAGDISEDLKITETGATLISGTGVDIYHYDEPQYVIENDSTFAVSFLTYGPAKIVRFHVIRFDKWGHVLAERAFDSVIVDFDRLFALNADSTGYLVGGIDYNNQPIVSTPCYNLDFNLDTTRLHDEIYWDFPLPGWRGCIVYPYIAKHPTSGCLYVVGSAGYDTNGNGVYQDAMIAKFDPNMSHIDKWNMTIDSPGPDQRAYSKSIDFFPDGSIAMCAMVNYGFYVARFDEDLNKISEVYHPNTGSCQGPMEICAMPNGDCLVTVEDDKIYHILADSFWSVDEAHNNGLMLATAYPNPGGNTLNIRTALPNARVEVYDMNGRLIHSQALTDNVTAIDATDWAEGVYVWKVMVGTSTLRQVQGSGTLAETGKWVKN